MVLLQCHVSLKDLWSVMCKLINMCDSLVLFLIFFPRGDTLPDNDVEKQYTWRTAVGVAFLCLLHGLIVIIVSAALLISRPHHLGTWANTLGIMATILAGIQYFPQIWMTWHLRHVGSLSIPMMLIQTPGSFVWAGSLAARLGVEGWSTWGVFLVTGCLQGCLLFMGIYFEVQARKGKQNTEGEGVSAIQKSTFDKENANYLQANVPSIVGYNPDQREADDEGGVNVENELNERTPLLNGSRK
jgi:hypothetical protein